MHFWKKATSGSCHYGKWGVTLIDKRRGKAVRVAPRAEAMEANKQSEFMSLRESGVPPTKIADEISDPLVERVLSAPDEDLFVVGPVFDYEWQEEPHTFESVICDACGEMVVERNARVQGGRVLCMPCADLG